MDKFISNMPCTYHDDLALCQKHGVAYQRDMSSDRVVYDDKYWAKVSSYEGSDIAAGVVAGRVSLLKRHAIPGRSVMDVGAGTGEFIRAAKAAGYFARGFDVMTKANKKLQDDGLYDRNINAFRVVTMWDVIEHLENPQDVLDRVRPAGLLLASVPIFSSLESIRSSKHYRPGEHLYYWTEYGFTAWLAAYGFVLLERSRHEMEAGRENIMAFAFRRDRGDG